MPTTNVRLRKAAPTPSNISRSLNVKVPESWSQITTADANSGCLVSRKVSELGGGGLRSILAYFQAACDFQQFFKKCDQLGLRDGAFSANELLRTGHPSYDKFNKSLDEVGKDAVIGLVFHGTHEQNVDAICCQGLDAQKRTGQAYGPGVSGEQWTRLAWL